MFRFNGCIAALVICACVGVNNGWSFDRKQDAYNVRYNDDAFYADNLQASHENQFSFKDTEQRQRQHDDTEIKKELTNLPKNDELFEGDMVMDSRLRDAVLGQGKRAVLQEENIKWPNGVLVYDIDPNFLPVGRKLLEKAIHEFETRTCIRFKRRTNEVAYVYYTSKENVCSSFIGRTGSKQKIHIGKDCMVLGTVIHETMHSLGFIHEHSRPDRDQYLDVKWDNIEKDEWSNFNKYSFSDISAEDVEYNYASLMHYRNDAFTKNGKDTLVAKGENGLHFGQRIKFSVGDVNGINHFYGCKDRISKPNYKGLFKDYSGKKNKKNASTAATDEGKLSAETKRRLQTMLKRFNNRIFDWKQQQQNY